MEKKFEIEKTERYKELANEVSIAQKYFNEVRQESEFKELLYWNTEEGRYTLTHFYTMEQKIEFIKKFSHNATAMAYLNMTIAQERLDEYVDATCNMFAEMMKPNE